MSSGNSSLGISVQCAMSTIIMYTIICGALAIAACFNADLKSLFLNPESLSALLGFGVLLNAPFIWFTKVDLKGEYGRKVGWLDTIVYLFNCRYVRGLPPGPLKKEDRKESDGEKFE